MMKLKKTKYSYMTSFNYTTFKETYRRVWQDENGEYFIKHNGEWKNVTNAKDRFIED